MTPETVRQVQVMRGQHELNLSASYLFLNVFERLKHSNIFTQPQILNGLHHLCERIQISTNNEKECQLLSRLIQYTLAHVDQSSLERSKMTELIVKLQQFDFDAAIGLASRYRLYRTFVKLVYQGGNTQYQNLYNHIAKGLIPV